MPENSISVVIPVFNESDNVALLHHRLRAALDAIARPSEIIFVNDGSTDRTASELAALAAQDSDIRVVNLRRNYGQTAAIMAGIDHARGAIIVPMDGDLQNDPADIARLVDTLEEGYDVVSGWRVDRKDQGSRTFPSRIANSLISRISGVRLNDYGCSLKAYRRDVIKGVKLYGEMHRFIPIYATWSGARVTEIPVVHHAREHGQSKYGMKRIPKVLLDLIVVQFLAGYGDKPMYVFGGFGILSLIGAVVVGIGTLWLKFVDGISLISTPLPLLVVFLLLTGFTSVLMGLLAELLVRTYYESQGKSVYQVRDTLNFDERA